MAGSHSFTCWLTGHLSLSYAYRLSLFVVRVVEKHCDPQSLQRDLQPHVPGTLPLAEFLKRLSMRQQGGDADCLFSVALTKYLRLGKL